MKHTNTHRHKPTILVIDDQVHNLKITGDSLKAHYDILVATNALDGLKILKTTIPDLILLDIFMPDMDGFSFVDQMHISFPNLNIPIIYVSSSQEDDIIKKSLHKGAHDYVLKPFEPQRLISKIENVLWKEEKSQFKSIYLHGKTIADTFFSNGIKAIDLNMLSVWSESLIKTVEHSTHPFKSILVFFENSYNEPLHNVKVAMLAVILGQHLNLTRQQLSDLAIAGILHDCGKVHLSTEVLIKSTYLETEEVEMVEKHPLYSYELAKQLGIHKAQILEAILYHHEKLDGTGYPHGLIGNAIPVFAQIIAVCDVFDALTTDRTYREHFHTYDALKLIKSEMSHQLNIKYVNSFIELLQY